MLQTIIQRVIRMVKFDHSVYKEIEHDENANVQAAVVVIVAALAAAIGTLIGTRSFGNTIIGLLARVLVGWLLWSFITMFIGTRVFKGEATFWEVARTLGYANAPGVLGIFGAIACLNVIAGLVALVLSLLFGFYATRESLDLPTDKAIITIAIGWVVMFVIMLLVGMIGL